MHKPLSYKPQQSTLYLAPEDYQAEDNQLKEIRRQLTGIREALEHLAAIVTLGALVIVGTIVMMGLITL